jgi:hypothetical protein
MEEKRMSDFLNPKSMVTPGMAGALVMFLSNAICFQFPEIAPRWAALLLSFVLGGVVIAAAQLRRLPAAGFWFINSLIIFAVAAGSAGVAAKTAAQTPGNATSSLVSALVPSAIAQPASTTGNTTALTKAQLQAQLDQANARIAAQQQLLEEAQQQAATAAAQAQEAKAQHAQVPQNAPKAAAKIENRFFKEW